MSDALATIVVVPRDHFGDAQESLESVLAHTERPYELVVVDGGSPRVTAAHLRAAEARVGFRRIATSHPLSPNQARNLGLTAVRTRYVVFLDNDVVVTPGWLPPLVDCAEETGASVVGPLVYEGRPLHTRIHFTGGEARVETRADGKRHLVDRILKDEPRGRRRTGCAEFHAMLVRTADLARLGGFDERLLSTRENLDFCMSVSAAGGSIWLEPRSRITYLPPDPLRLSDVPYFALRWSDAWERASFEHLREKWGLVHDEYFEHQGRILGWRRREILMEGCLLRWLPSTRLRLAAERALRALERAANDWWARRETPRLGLTGRREAATAQASPR